MVSAWTNDNSSHCQTNDERIEQGTQGERIGVEIKMHRIFNIEQKKASKRRATEPYERAHSRAHIRC